MNMSLIRLISLECLALAAIVGCSSSADDSTVAGGVSEETNTVAGILSNVDGKPVKGVAVYARHMSDASEQFVDTTSAAGEFSFPIVRKGSYGISASTDSLAAYGTFKFDGSVLDASVSLNPVGSVSYRVALEDRADLEGIRVYVPGTDWSSRTDSEGLFTLDNVPYGSYSIMVQSPDEDHYQNTEVSLLLNDTVAELIGPVTGLVDVADNSVPSITLPAVDEYGLRSWWPMNNVVPSEGNSIVSDIRGTSRAIVLYGDVKQEDGCIDRAVRFNGADQFGVVEDDGGILDSLTELTLEMFVKFNGGLSVEESFQKNVVGKLGFGSSDDKDVFSLAVVNGACGVDRPSLVFFMADGTDRNFSCENAAVSSEQLTEGQWIHVVVTWKNGVAKIYQNGVVVGSVKTSIELLEPSDEPIFFGKENLDFVLDDVRLGAKAITSADVLYRYKQKTGGKL